MSHQDGSVSSSEDASAESVIRFEKVNEKSALDTGDSTEGVAYSDKESLDNSSDDYNKKRDKKGGKQSKSKVKIKTLTIDGQLVYFCKICDKVFTRRKDKLNHELAHSGESVLTCTECGKEYLHESSLASHMRTHAGDPLFMCDLCPKMFAQSHHLKTHILSHSEPTNFVCKTCYKEFPTASDLNHHNRVQSKLEIANYWCKMCKVYFCRTHKLTCDTRLHAFCCSACNELFHTHKKLKIHMKKFAHYSLDKPKYIEPLREHELYPDKLQENLKKLQSQKESDLTRKPIKNDVNGKRPSDSYSDIPFKKFKLSVRKLIIDGDQSSTSMQDSATEASKEVETELKSPTRHRKGKPYCKKCNKSFKDSLDLDRHKALVHEDKQHSFKCEICSMEFASKDALDRHGFKHSGDRMHVCPVCGQEFPDSSQLTQHLRIHVCDFPYKCSQCGKAFRLKIQLIQHVRLHIAQDASGADRCPGVVEVVGEQLDHSQGQVDNLKCHLCSKTFCYQYNLLNHMKLHSNGKSFQCYICCKMFATKSNLQRHLQMHIKQGLDVDVHNIIIDGDSKLELDSMREKLTRDNAHNTEHINNYQDIDGIEKKNLKQSFFGIQRSVSNFELESQVEENSNLDISEVQGHGLGIRRMDIKAEVEDDMESFSEQSFSSSFTRDSERSDPFKFSSDDSYTFKTVMAKERRRLRRRWRKNRDLFMQSGLQDLSKLKKRRDVNSDVVSAERDGSDQEDDVTNMNVELNTVTSEFDDVTTVFVNLTEKKMISCKKTVVPSITETTLDIGSSSSPKIELQVKKEIEQDYSNNEPGASESNLRDTVHTYEHTDQVKSSGKMLMFEFHAEQLLDGHIKCHEGSTDVISVKRTDEHSEIGEEAKINTSKTEQVQQDESSRPSSQNLQPPDQKSHLKFIVSDANLASEYSNLEKLQAVFEHSSKYLPLPLTSSSRKISPQVHQYETQMSMKDEPAVNISMHPHSMNSCNSLSQEKQQKFIVEDSCDGKVTMLPQNNTFIDNTPQQVKTQDMNSNLDLKRGSLQDANILEQSCKPSLATAETSRNEFSSKNSAKIPNENSSSSYSNQSVRKSGTGFKNCPDSNSYNMPTLTMSQPFSVANITSTTPQSSSFGISSVTDSHSNYNIFNLTSQALSLTTSNFTSQASCYNSANLLIESQSPAISRHMVMSAGQDSSSCMQHSCHSSLNLTLQTSDNISSNLMAQSTHADSGHTAQLSSHSNSMQVSQSVGHTICTSTVQSGISNSTSMTQSGHAGFTPTVQSDHPNSTPVILSSPTPMLQLGHADPTSMLHPGSSLMLHQPGHNPTLFTQTIHDASSKLSMQYSSHPTSTVNMPPRNHISSFTAHVSGSRKSNAHARASDHKTAITSQSLTHQSSSPSTQQASHSSSNLTAPPPTSLANPLYCNSFIGTPISEAGYLQPSLNLSSSSAFSMKLNPALNSVSTGSDNIAVNSGYGAHQNNTSSFLGGCFISANPLLNAPCAIGLNTAANPSFSLAVNPDFSLNPSTIFDASNPMYRDMNMMDLISTSSTDFPQPVAAPNVGFFNQGGLEAQLRHDMAIPVGVQSGILQSQNPFLNIGNPALGSSFGISGNQVGSLFPQRFIPVSFGQLDNQLLTSGPIGVGDGTLCNSGSVYSTLPRDIYFNGNGSVPYLSMQLGPAGGSVPLDMANILPQNTGGFSDMGPRPCNIRGPLSMNIADLGGSSFINTGNLTLNQANFRSNFPLSISTNPQMINNLNSMGIFPNSGLQNNLSNIMTPSNINFLNPAMLPQNAGLLPGSSTGFITDFSTGFFPQF